MISLIAILTMNRVIGRRNVIPWYFSVDRMWFKLHTLNKPVIMGRKTFESIGYVPLPNRLNIVLSKKLSQDQFKNVIIIDDPIRLISLVKKYNEVMIIGGSAIYSIFLSTCARMYLTYINIQYDYGDSWFPIYSKQDWKLITDIHRSCLVKNNHIVKLNFQIFER